jgi:hypothetical protein
MYVTPRTKPSRKVIRHVPKVTVLPCLFERSDDWQIQFDLVPQDGCETKECIPNGVFPPHIAATAKRPDGIMWSDKLKTVMWIELTSPWEDNLTKWYFDKHENYTGIVSAAEENGWKVIPLCVEVGTRGYINDKWMHMRKAVGLSSKDNSRMQKAVKKAALRCSYFLYLSRRQKEWNTRKLLA